MRTLVLMVLTLLASLHFLWRTHRRPPPRAHVAPDVLLRGKERP
jgi:hypothetical protein